MTQPTSRRLIAAGAIGNRSGIDLGPAFIAMAAAAISLVAALRFRETNRRESR